MKTENNPILEKSFKFSLEILEFTTALNAGSRYEIRGQILRSGTSIGANIHEGQRSESRADFIHKKKLAHKECIETEYWLKLCRESPNPPSPKELPQSLNEISRLLNSIISTAKKNQNRVK